MSTNRTRAYLLGLVMLAGEALGLERRPRFGTGSFMAGGVDSGRASVAT
jgi:hypothetical protein